MVAEVIHLQVIVVVLMVEAVVVVADVCSRHSECLAAALNCMFDGYCLSCFLCVIFYVLNWVVDFCAEAIIWGLPSAASWQELKVSMIFASKIFVSLLLV